MQVRMNWQSRTTLFEPTGRGECMVEQHAGTIDWLQENTFLIFCSQKIRDYNEKKGSTCVPKTGLKCNFFQTWLPANAILTLITHY